MIANFAGSEIRPGSMGRPFPGIEAAILARTRLGAAVAPREIAFDHHLPKNKAGKIMRRLLRARELGVDEGDTPTWEGLS